ncbi:hypothetical protein Catovirus_1_1083 [Catovirus CTV1]|uniref:Uncharacterized protein n=1 Tax=Catovirus CTV1 TaxID=1977631 RepID=A0A1V0SBE7_9VIRU|nr:hypothetical protein Catovirus_1_1083 [Catovirus CTV1]
MYSDNKDIDDLASDMEYFVSMFNIFQSYYKKLYKKPDNEDMFSDVDLNCETSTNRSMELLYEYMYEYKTNKKQNENLVKLYEKDSTEINQYDNIYALLVEDKITKLSPSFLSIIIYLADVEWTELDWKITKIKGEI